MSSAEVLLSAADLGKKFTFVLYAQNSEGSVASSAVTYQFAAKPATPTQAPSLHMFNSTLTEVSYLFTDSVNGATLLALNLQFRDSLTNTWTDMLEEDSLASVQYLKTEKGVGYELRFRVMNKYGWSAFSPTAQFTAADLPSQPAMASVVSVTSVAIELAFDLLTIDDGGLPISDYSLEFSVRGANLFTQVAGFSGQQTFSISTSDGLIEG